MNEMAAGKTVGIKENLLQVRTWLGFAVAGVVIYIFLRNFDLASALRIISKAKIGYLFLAAIVFYASLPLRGARWGSLLKPSGVRVENGPLSHYYFLSWFANALLPARIGDIYRAYLLRKNKDVPIALSLGVLVSERVIDLGVAAALLVLSGAYYWATIKDLPESSYLFWGILAIVGIIVLFILLARFMPFIIKRLPEKFGSRLNLFRAGIFKWPKLIPTIVVMTAAIWLSEAMRLYLVFQAFNISSGFLLAVFISQASLILMSLPVSPAGLGLVELLMLKLLSAAEITSSLAGAVTLTDRLISYWSLLALGGIVYFLSPRAR